MADSDSGGAGRDGGDGASARDAEDDRADAGHAAGDAAKVKKPKRRKKHEAGVALGAAIAGFEQAVFRKLPPPHEIVEQARHRGPVAAADGTMFTLVMPGDAPPEEDHAKPSE